MKRKILLPLLFALVALKGFSQMTIGASTAPNAASVLDLSNATTLGLLPPQVQLQSISDATTIVNPPTSLLVYNIGPAGTSPNNVTAGYYYNAGTSASPNWVRFFAQNNNSSSAWTTTGNSGTTASTAAIGSIVNNNFIGTTDAKDLVIASNDLERMRVTSSGNIGIGTITPSSSAIVQMYSTTQGVSFPTMDSTHRDAITSPVAGLTLYDQTTGCLEFYVGGKWQPIGCGCTQKPAAPTTIAVSPTGTICPGSMVSYSISDVSTATSYTWAYSGNIGSGGTYTGQGTTQLNVTYGTTSLSAGNWTVSATNACGTSTTASTAVSLTPVPATPGTITQSPSGTVCAGQTGITFSITGVTNATSYNWTVPGTATITAGSGTNSITVTWGSTAGNVTVTAVGCNGNSTGSSSLTVSLLPVPATPGTITPSSTNYCPGATVTFSITGVTNATSYNWTVPSGSVIAASGTNTYSGNATSISVTIGSTSGNVTVSASDCNGTSTGSATLAISPGHGSQTFSYTGADQTFTVPTCVTSINVELWGGGGGAFGPYFNFNTFSYTGAGYGGGGGFISGSLTVTGGSTLKVIVGGGGAYGTTAVYGNGGKGNANDGTGCGGGRSAIQITSGTDAVTAGGGGGGGYPYTNGDGNGGGGGGAALNGSNGTYGRNTACATSEYGVGGTSTAGGAGGTQTCASTAYNGNAGSQYIGGNVSTTVNYPGGGGGGGYYGGGSGSSYYGGGGGGGSNGYGAGFTLTLSSGGGTEPNPTTSTTAYALAANPTDANYTAYTTSTGGYIGRGGTGSYNWNPASTGDNNTYYGGNGYVVISW